MVRSSCPACLGVGVWLLMALRWWGMGSSTLLGPEGSAVVLLFWLGFALVGVVVCGWASVPPFAFSCPVGCVGVLVGLLFEICIVDASIFVACSSSALMGLSHGWVVGVVALAWPALSLPVAS